MGTFTFMLVVVTAWLVRATLQLWAAGERQVSVAEKSAEAALLQAKAMIAAESAVFAVSSLKLVGYKDEKASIALEGLDPAPPGVPPPFCRILIGLQNRGRTEMTINRIFCDWVIDATVDERPEHHFEEIWNGALPRENSIWSASQNGLRLDNLAAEHIGNFGRFLWVYGKIIYTDFMGDQFEHGFIARWTTSEGFVRDPLANYEYKRKI